MIARRRLRATLVALIVLEPWHPSRRRAKRRRRSPLVIHAAATWAGVAPELLAAVVWVESRGHPWALSIRGKALYPRTRAEAGRAAPGRPWARRHRSGADPLSDLGSRVRAATRGAARPVGQPPRGRGDPSARHGAGTRLLGRRGALSLRDAAGGSGHTRAEWPPWSARCAADPTAAGRSAAVTGWWAPGCLVGSALSVAALLADPIGAPERLAAHARAELAELETLARVALALDSGPAMLRPLLGFQPAEEAAAEILGDGAAGVSRALTAVTPLREALLTARRPTRAAPASFTDAVAAWIVDAVRGPDPSRPQRGRDGGRPAGRDPARRGTRASSPRPARARRGRSPVARGLGGRSRGPSRPGPSRLPPPAARSASARPARDEGGAEPAGGGAGGRRRTRSRRRWSGAGSPRPSRPRSPAGSRRRPTGRAASGGMTVSPAGFVATRSA